jgi:hypothetical protein
MLTFIIVFLLLIFIYIHMLFHWNVSNEIDIPHIATPNKDILEQVADSKQPFLFEKDLTQVSDLAMTGHEKDVQITKPDNTTLYVPHKGMLNAIKKEPYISNKNYNFVDVVLMKETPVSSLDQYLAPPMTMFKTKDIIYGNHGVATKLNRSANYRNYFVCLNGTVEIKLLPPRCEDHLTNTNIDLWNPTDNDTETIKECDVINITLSQGSIIHIPAFWWYTFKFKEQGCLLSMSYTTYMNAISQIPNKISSYIKIKKIEF